MDASAGRWANLPSSHSGCSWSLWHSTYLAPVSRRASSLVWFSSELAASLSSTYSKGRRILNLRLPESFTIGV